MHAPDSPELLAQGNVGLPPYQEKHLLLHRDPAKASLWVSCNFHHYHSRLSPVWQQWSTSDQPGSRIAGPDLGSSISQSPRLGLDFETIKTGECRISGQTGRLHRRGVLNGDLGQNVLRGQLQTVYWKVISRLWLRKRFLRIDLENTKM